MASGIIQIRRTKGRFKAFSDHAKAIGDAISDVSVRALKDAYGPGYARSGIKWPMNPVRSSARGEFPAAQTGNLLSSIGRREAQKRYLWEIGMFSNEADSPSQLRLYLADIEGINITKGSRFGLSTYIRQFATRDTQNVAASVKLP
jgi:hypothetical protein